MTEKQHLAAYAWGRGEVNGQEVIFPWELTMSELAKEVAENTARRTAKEIIKMTGDRGWNRPVQIRVVTEAPGQSVTIEHSGSEDIFVTPDEGPAGAKKASEKK